MGTEPAWISIAIGVQSVIQSFALLTAALWALFRFGLRREGETALEIDLNYSAFPIRPDMQLVAFDVSLANKSAVKLAAKRTRNPAYTDDWEKLAFGIDLLIREIDTRGLVSKSEVKWFPTPKSTVPMERDLEIDLASDYVTVEEHRGRTTNDREITHFWLEPGEVYHLASVSALEPGTYLAMVTFVGDRNDDEFWRRSFLVSVPLEGPALSHRVAK